MLGQLATKISRTERELDNNILDPNLSYRTRNFGTVQMTREMVESCISRLEQGPWGLKKHPEKCFWETFTFGVFFHQMSLCCSAPSNVFMPDGAWDGRERVRAEWGPESVNHV